MNPQTKLSFREKVGYALGDTGANIAWRPLVSFLPFFYTDVFVLPAAAVTWLLLIPRLSDGITDLIMGTIADRTQTRWGKFRPWMLWSALPFGLLLALTFTTPNFGQGGKLIWAYSTYILLTLAYTANNVPYNALMGVMTSDLQERTKLSAYRFFGAFAGGAIAYFLIDYLVAFLGNGDTTKGYQYTFFVFAIMLSAFSLITFFSTKERVKVLQDSNSSLRNDVQHLFRNRSWLILILVGFLFLIFNSIKQGTAVYYFAHYAKQPGLGGIYLGVLVLVSMAATLVTPFLTRLLGKKQLFLLAMIFSGLLTLLLYFAEPDDIWYVFIIGNISEFAAAILPVLFFSMLGDSADYSEWKSNRRSTGLVYSAGTFAMKSGGAVAGAIMLMVLSIFGYAEGGHVQSPEALIGIKLNMSVVPVVFIALACVVMMFYPLSKQLMEQVENELQQRRNNLNLNN